MKKKKSIVFTGGGTGGHVTPNLAIMEHFLADYDVHYIGSSGIEKTLVKQYKEVTFHEIECVKLIRSLTLKNLTIPFKLLSSVKQAKKILDEIQPALVFSKGGYVGLPVALACKKLPLFIHESDSTLGLANRIALRFADALFTSFDTIKHPKAIYTGSPIRKSVYQGNLERAKKDYYAQNSKPYLLVFGGSQGAKTLNDFVFDNIDELLSRFNILHVKGKNEKRSCRRKGYFGIGYCEHIEDLYALSSFVLSRGGANSLFEIIALKKPCVCVPLKKGSRGDQIINAKYFEDKGCLLTVDEDEISTQSVFTCFENLRKNHDAFVENMSKQKVDGTGKITLKIKVKLQDKKVRN